MTEWSKWNVPSARGAQGPPACDGQACPAEAATRQGKARSTGHPVSAYRPHPRGSNFRMGRGTKTHRPPNHIWKTVLSTMHVSGPLSRSPSEPGAALVPLGLRRAHLTAFRSDPYSGPSKGGA